MYMHAIAIPCMCFASVVLFVFSVGWACTCRLSGRLHLLFVPLARALPLLRDGRVRLLAVAGNDRNAAVPDVPTSKEMGFPSLFLEGLIALFGWRGMPTQSMELLAREADTALASLDDRLMARGQIARRERLADLASLLRSEQ